MILALVDEAVEAGARHEQACAILGITERTMQRWREDDVGDDERAGPRRRPANAFTPKERAKLLEVVNSPEYRDLPPKQAVPRLADEGRYIGSESTIYRFLREEGLDAHRGRAKPRTVRTVDEHIATAANRVWTWDITYLLSSIRGKFFYLYMIEDVWSRRVVGFEVHAEESMEASSALIEKTCIEQNIDPDGLVLHSDNGGPMKGSTMLTTLRKLGIVASFSRPSVSDDNPFIEALFRTLKYRPEYPQKPFDTLEDARAWVVGFVGWYNTEHRHSGIRFVTPDERHDGREAAVLANRVQVYERARRANPNRWSRGMRDWSPAPAVFLNPKHEEQTVDGALSRADRS